MEPAYVPSQFNNRVLASLPPSELQRLGPHLSPVTLKANRTLHDRGQLIDSVYFLESGVCSSVTTMASGVTVEVGITGRDGFVGIKHAGPRLRERREQGTSDP